MVPNGVSKWFSNTYHFRGSTQENQKPRFKQTLVPHAHSSVIHSSHKVEIAQVSIHEQMDKHNLMCMYDGILFSLEKELSSVQFSHSTMSNSLWPHGLQHTRYSLSFPELAQTHVHWVSDAIQPSHPLSSPLLLPSIFPSISVFYSESVLCIRWPKYWSFSFSISPSNEYSGLISFRS